MKDLLIYPTLAVVMQRVLDAVNHKYTHYIYGSCPVDKVEQTLVLFAMNYQAAESRYERSKRARLGLGNIHLVLWWNKGEEKIHWWLLATPPQDGPHPIHQTDNLKDALVTGQRITINGFELVKQPKKGTDHAKLTWRMTQKKFEDFHDRIVEAVRSRSHNRMNYVLVLLWACPGFSGIRIQTGNLVRLYRAEVKRASLKSAPQPPKKLFYLRRISHLGIPKKQFIEQMKDKT